MKNTERQVKLGMHSYIFHLSGSGENWGFQDAHALEKSIDLFQLIDLAVERGLDELHITSVGLESLDPAHLAKVKTAAEAHDFYLEYNISFNTPYNPRISSTTKDTLLDGKAVGAELVKFSLDIERPRPLYGICFYPGVMRQLSDRYDEFRASIPLMEELGPIILIENHCDTYAGEVIWLVQQLDHSGIGACVGTINSLIMLEGPEACVGKTAPYADHCHFCDNKLVMDPDGTHSTGVAIGQGDIDHMKVLKMLRGKAPLDCITFEMEYKVGNDSLEVAHKREIQTCKESTDYLCNVLKVDAKNR